MKVLMCPPIHYATTPEGDVSTVMVEWRGLYRLLREELGIQVDLLEPKPSLPQLVLAGGGGFVWGDTFVVSRFRDSLRRYEPEAWENFFLVRGYDTPTLPEGCYFEGEQDLLIVEGVPFVGHRAGDDLAAHNALSTILGRDVQLLRFADGWDLPLSACLCPLGNGQALFYPEAFDLDARRAIEGSLAAPRAMDPQDVRRFGCNALVADGDLILPEGCVATVAQLKQDGFRVHTLPLHSYARHCAGPKALVLKIED